jgi:two-component system sensor histidine kinase/response regulator
MLAFIGLLAAQLVVWVWQEHYVSAQLQAVQSDIPDLDAFLEQKTNLSQDIGALTVLGLSGRTIKKQALNELPDNDQEALERLAVIQQLYQVDGVYVLNAQGKIVAHKTQGKSSLGNKVEWRPYFKQAMQGVSNVYPAVGSSSSERGLYFAVPIRATTQVDSEIIGVLMLKKTIEDIQQRLDLYNSGKVLLLSPQGVVFATNDHNWLYRVMPPITPEKMHAIEKQKQFGKLFQEGGKAALPLPFEWMSRGHGQLTFDGQKFVAVDTDVSWSDPLGDWQLLVMRPAQLMLTPAHYLMVYIGVPLLVVLLGWLLLWQREQWLARRRLSAQIHAAEVKTSALIEAVDNGILNIDMDGRIVYANAAARNLLGYDDDALMNAVFLEVIQASPASINPHQALSDACRYGERYQSAWQYITPVQAQLTLALSLIPLTSGDHWDGFVCVFHDTSEVTRAQQQIQSQLEALMQLNRVSVDRELMMVVLKQQINTLLVESGKEPHYVIAD